VLVPLFQVTEGTSTNRTLAAEVDAATRTQEMNGLSRSACTSHVVQGVHPTGERGAQRAREAEEDRENVPRHGVAPTGPIQDDAHGRGQQSHAGDDEQREADLVRQRSTPTSDALLGEIDGGVTAGDSGRGLHPPDCAVPARSGAGPWSAKLGPPPLPNTSNLTAQSFADRTPT
jgi:hypothetical protein